MSSSTCDRDLYLFEVSIFCELFFVLLPSGLRDSLVLFALLLYDARFSKAVGELLRVVLGVTSHVPVPVDAV